MPSPIPFCLQSMPPTVMKWIHSVPVNHLCHYLCLQLMLRCLQSLLHFHIVMEPTSRFASTRSRTELASSIVSTFFLTVHGYFNHNYWLSMYHFSICIVSVYFACKAFGSPDMAVLIEQTPGVILLAAEVCIDSLK